MPKQIIFYCTHSSDSGNSLTRAVASARINYPCRRSHAAEQTVQPIQIVVEERDQRPPTTTEIGKLLQLLATIAKRSHTIKRENK